MAFTVTSGFTFSSGDLVTPTRVNAATAGSVANGQSYSFAAGSVGTPSVNTSGNSSDTDTGIYWPAADTLAGVAGGQEGWRVIGNKLVTGSTVTNGVQLGTVAATTGAPETSGTTQTNGAFRSRGGNGVLDVGHRASGIAWMQACDATALGTEYGLEINPNGGNVSIGVASPASKLHVRVTTGGAGVSNVLRLDNVSGSAGAVGQGASLSLYTENATPVTYEGARIAQVQTVATAGSEANDLRFSVFLAGSNVYETFRLNSDGSIRVVATSSATATAAGAGAIRWNGTKLQGSDGTNWNDLW